MEVRKIRRVGNSYTLTVPSKFVRGGFEAGQPVIVEQLETGELLIRPIQSHREPLRQVMREVAEEYRATIEKLAAHDRGDRVRETQTPPQDR